MDIHTEKHLRKWTEHQFAPLDDRQRRFDAMARVTGEYPEIENCERGWWRVYELALELGYVIDPE